MVEILVLYRHSLLAEGVESLLKKEDLKVTGMNLEDPEAIKLVSCLGRGAVVLLDTSETNAHPSINVPQVLLENPGAVVIVLNSQDNKVEIFRKEERAIARLSDLVDIIREL
ncbi:MAG: hypothetical protein Q8P59_04075 [Dehalococcoidia bacterium]|nr:hypothetical protein [Dehalococcoidia bacterium]